MARWFPVYIFVALMVFAGANNSGAFAQGSGELDTVYGDFDGRGYVLDRPRGKRRSKRPLVIFLHGGFGNADLVRRVMWRGMSEAMERNNFMMAYLNGSRIGLAGRFRKWNAGKCCGRGSFRRNDVAYIRGFIRYAVKRYKADRRRIYLMGHSNGGMMAYRYICAVPNSVAAVVSISSTLMTDNCSPEGVSGILHIHGRVDERVPVEGGPARFPGARGLQFPSLDFTRNAFDRMGVPFKKKLLRGVGHNLRELDYRADITGTALRFFKGKRLK